MSGILQGAESEAESAFVGRIDAGLRALFRTVQPVATLPVPGAMAREICLDAAIEHRALVLIAGADGEALAATAESLGKEVLRVMVPPGRQVERAHLIRFLQGPEVDTVVVAHVESTTGAEAPLAELADVLRTRKGIHLFVDASLSLSASPLETDRWGLDTVLAAGDGALGMPRGISFVAASARMLTRARSEPGRGRQLDLVAHHAAAVEGRMLAPLAGPLARSVEDQLTRLVDAEGLTSRWERHARLRGMVERWVAERGDVSFVAASGRRATTLSCLILPRGRRVEPAVAALAGAQYEVMIGPRGDAGQYLRISHAGELTLEALAGTLAAIGRELDMAGRE